MLIVIASVTFLTALFCGNVTLIVLLGLIGNIIFWGD